MIHPEDLIQIGSLARTHGKMGEVQCRTINEYWDENDTEFIFLMLDHIPVPFRVTDWRYKGCDLLFTLKGISTEEQALALIGNEVYMHRQDVVVQNTLGVLSWQDIVGYTMNGCVIEEIDDSTANVLATLSDGRLIPLHEDLITDVDHQQRTLTMNLPEGL